MRRNENPEHTHGHGCVLIEAPITHTFGPKEKMPLALGNEKRTNWALKSLLFHSNTLTFRAKQRQLFEAQKVFF